MLQNATAEFPFNGSTGYVRGSGEQVGILQRNRDGGFLVKRYAASRSEGASLTRTHAPGELCETLDEAMGLHPVKRASRRATRQPAPRKQRRA